MNRTAIRERLAKAMITAEDPGVVFCVEPLGAAERDGGERLGRLLDRLTNDPERGFVVATTNAFIFAFAGQRVRNETPGNGEPDGTPTLVTENENFLENEPH
jgi:ABC-type lipoprotein export system ATPase subunit